MDEVCNLLRCHVGIQARNKIRALGGYPPGAETLVTVPADPATHRRECCGPYVDRIRAEGDRLCDVRALAYAAAGDEGDLVPEPLLPEFPIGACDGDLDRYADMVAEDTRSGTRAAPEPVDDDGIHR